MEPYLGVFVAIFGGVFGVKWLLGYTNRWLYESKLGDKRFSLPPGDLGWPFIGNMWSFLRAFKSSDPDSFISSFVTRFGRTGIYKAFMFGNPSVIVTTPEACRRVLTDDEAFKPGWPTSTVKLIGEKSFIGISYEEHKRLRRLTAAPVNGPEALSIYLRYIEDIVISGLDKWASMGQIEFLTELRKLTFRIVMHVFLSSESEQVLKALEREYTTLNYGVRAMAINIPGFAYHKALKARKNLVAIFQSIVNERKLRRSSNPTSSTKDMMDALLDAEDENGRRLNDEEIIDVLVMYLNAGHESSGHITMWATIFLQKHPKFFHKAKAEQEAIVKNRPPAKKGLTLKEIRQMDYLSKVIDETLRLVTFSFVVFREAKVDVSISGYTIPKGWKVLVWFRNVHLDPEIYPEPKEFNPSRWDALSYFSRLMMRTLSHPSVEDRLAEAMARLKESQEENAQLKVQLEEARAISLLFQEQMADKDDTHRVIETELLGRADKVEKENVELRREIQALQKKTSDQTEALQKKDQEIKQGEAAIRQLVEKSQQDDEKVKKLIELSNKSEEHLTRLLTETKELNKDYNKAVSALKTLEEENQRLKSQSQITPEARQRIIEEYRSSPEVRAEILERFGRGYRAAKKEIREAGVNLRDLGFSDDEDDPPQ